MRMLLVAVVLFCFVSSTAGQTRQSADSFLCVTDHLAGFTMDKTTKQWRTANFKGVEKFLVTRSSLPKTAWEVRRIGNHAAISECKNDFNEGGSLLCEGLFVNFKFNRKHLRFLAVVPVGYWNYSEDVQGFRDGDFEPTMGIGKCTPL